MVYLFVKFDEFASASLCNRRDMIFLPTPDCSLDLECGNQTLVCDTPTHCALSFYEVSLNLLE